MEYKNIEGKIYKLTAESNLFEYVGDEDDTSFNWNIWADKIGAKRGTVDDMLSIGDDE